MCGGVGGPVLTQAAAFEGQGAHSCHIKSVDGACPCQPERTASAAPARPSARTLEAGLIQ